MAKIKKMATYAMASAMIACAGISTGNIGVQAAAKAPVQSSKVSKANVDYEQMYKDYISNFIKGPTITSTSGRTIQGYILNTFEYNVDFSEVKGAKSYEVMTSWNKDFIKDPETGFTPCVDKVETTKFHAVMYVPTRYVKVRANFGNGIYSRWSEPQRFDLK